jgi:crotonobetainyl-CoA:carnitine CoA-transferase CaiB-like acyl-CoA transferase
MPRIAEETLPSQNAQVLVFNFNFNVNDTLSVEQAVAAPFATGSARVAHREELNAIVAERFGELDSDPATKLLDEAGIPVAVARELEHANTYPEALIEQTKQLGIFGLAVPRSTAAPPSPPPVTS